MGLGTSQLAYMKEVSKFKKGSEWGNLNGVAVLEEKGHYLKGGWFPTVFTPSQYSNGLGDELSGCFLKFPRDKAKREQCQLDFQARQNAQISLQQQALQTTQQALMSDERNQWTTGKIVIVSVVGLAALTGMAILVNKYGK